jgi:8-oxo-dGTP pyrophosphatase MutT (NUDIX family)
MLFHRSNARKDFPMMIETIADFAPQGVEAGVGLALQDESQRYLFFLAGSRHTYPPGDVFYAGIGGHLEAGEDWMTCAQREAVEEIGTQVEIIPASVTWYIPHQGPVGQVKLSDRPRPFALYEMIHPPQTPRAGEIYRIVIYTARLHAKPKDLPPEEVLGVIALTVNQVIRGPERKPSLAELLEEGASLLAGEERVDFNVRLYPLGTASALAHIFRHCGLGTEVT